MSEFRYRRHKDLEEWSDKERQHTKEASDIFATYYFDHDDRDFIDLETKTVLRFFIGAEYGFILPTLVQVDKCHFTRNGKRIPGTNCYIASIGEENLSENACAYRDLTEVLHRLNLELDYMRQKAEYTHTKDE